MTTKTSDHLNIPAGLSKDGERAAKIIRDYLTDNKLTWCESDLFMTPQEWGDRGEQYGNGSILILIHETGAAGEALSYDKAACAARPYHHLEKLMRTLASAGFYSEQMYSWSSAVYLSDKG